jgi:lipopolysaccharide transport system ATP-binding protein
MLFDGQSLMTHEQPSEGTATAGAGDGEVAIRVSGVSKCYELYGKPQDRLKQLIYPRLQRMFGRPIRHYAREFWALKDVSFELAKGETVGIIGRNGSGKSTLLQLICGTLNPTSGFIHTNGRVAALLELGAGFNPEFTGRENVYMSATVLGLSKKEIDARFDEIAAFADIGQFIDQPVKTYSSGMYVRLAFAVNAHVDADILVIDEALAVGDAFFVQKCMRFLRKFMEIGTVIFVSHDTGAVLNLCNRALWLANGRVKLIGAPKEVAAAYLQTLFELKQGESALIGRMEKNQGPPLQHDQLRDMRLDFINTTQYRNDIQLFNFAHDAEGFGKGGASIISVHLIDECSRPFAWIVGGEFVTLIIQCVANSNMFNPIVGFFVKDRLGQAIFGDNTFITYMSTPLSVLSGQTFQAQFDFRMPILPVGDYSICAAVAEGTQEEHVQHHWVHEALLFKVHSSSVCHGLIGVPIKSIRLSVT